MSLDVYLEVVKPCTVFEANYTHNTNAMAEAAGIYKAVWRPEEVGITTAKQLIAPLRNGIAKMEDTPDKFIAMNPSNGWGSYETFLPWLKAYLAACEENPDASVRACR